MERPELPTTPFNPSPQDDRSANAVNLRIGSDVEIAQHLSGRLRVKHGQIVYCEGHLWHFDETYWRSFDAPALRRLVHEYDGTLFTSLRGWPSTIKLTKTKIDSILRELSAINERPEFFQNPKIGINCRSGFILFDQNGTPELIANLLLFLLIIFVYLSSSMQVDKVRLEIRELKSELKSGGKKR